MNCTVDASVFVSAVRAEENYHLISRQFLQLAQTEAIVIFCPVLVLPECAAAIARPTGNAALVEELIALIENFPNLHLVSLDDILARRAAQIAVAQRLRGADAVYTAVAEMFQTTLTAWDTEILQRAPAIVPTLTPAGWIEQFKTDL
jgi:predicted nucleic acid-binding protein